MSRYLESHPWLTFRLDPRRLSTKTWMLLGEAVSKVEHVAGVPLSPDVAEKLHYLYLAKGVLATTAIEGNTLTEDEVQRHLRGDLELPPSRQYLAIEVSNIVSAVNQIGDEVVESGSQPLTPEMILRFNRQVLDELELGAGVEPGRFRNHDVGVGSYRAVPFQDCERLIDKFCDWLNDLDFPEGQDTAYSILVAIAAHLYFVWIHPFGDGNGRTARLIEFRYLMQAGFPTPAAHLLSNFYNLTRGEYYRQLQEASAREGDMTGFIEYAIEGLVDQLRDQLGVIRDHQWSTAWRNYVYERFGSKLTKATSRRRRLVLDLSDVREGEGWTSMAEIPELTPRLARAYADKTSKTLTRDINALIDMRMVERSGRLIRANRKLILAFLPSRAPQDPGRGDGPDGVDPSSA